MKHTPLRMAVAALAFAVCAAGARAQAIDVEGQPLAANIGRLLKALDFIGQPLPVEASLPLERAVKMEDAKEMQNLLDPHVLFQVHLNPEARVKVKRGTAPAILQQHGYTAFLVKVH